ncbi:MAG: hypothetical protein WCF94_00910 [bacterium]
MKKILDWKLAWDNYISCKVAPHNNSVLDMLLLFFLFYCLAIASLGYVVGYFFDIPLQKESAIIIPILIALTFYGVATGMEIVRRLAEH